MTDRLVWSGSLAALGKTVRRAVTT